jgi:hypothetical protein
MLSSMQEMGREPPLALEPPAAKPRLRNAYKKVLGIRHAWPTIFWALGPAGYGYVFRVARARDGDTFDLVSVKETSLRFTSH